MDVKTIFNIKDKTKSVILVLIIVLVLVMIFLIFRYNTNREAFADTDNQVSKNQVSKNIDAEALENIASVYNSNNFAVTNLTVTGTSNLVPPGSIMAWHPKDSDWKNSIPQGWVLCDGKNGTPDLRGRFLIGQGKGEQLTERIFGNIGGEEAHTLTEEEIPSHAHELWINNKGTNKGEFSDNLPARIMMGDRWSSGTSYSNSGLKQGKLPTALVKDTGGDKPHNNMPPFYVVVYIMRQ